MNRQARGGGNSNCRWQGILNVADQRGIAMEPAWLDWARRLNALAQSGLTFAESLYDIERYMAIRKIAAEMIAHGSGAKRAECSICLPATPGTLRRRWTCVASCSRMVRSSWSKSDPMECGPCQGAGLTWVIPRLMRSSGRSGRNPVTRPVPRSCSPSSTVTATITRLMSTTSTRSSSGAKSSAAPRRRATKIQRVSFFAEDRIPTLSLTRNVPAQITRMFEHYRQPDLPADFDEVQLPD